LYRQLFKHPICLINASRKLHNIKTMKTLKNILLCFVLFTMLLSNAKSQNLEWAKGMGSTNNDGGNSIAVDAHGNVYTSGYFNGTVDFDPGLGIFNLTSMGLDDIFISKFDAYGNFVWAKSIGGTNNDWGNSIALDNSGNVYCTGYYCGTADFDPGVGTYNLTATGLKDIFILKLDSSGNFVWAKSIGNTGDDIGNLLVLDTSANVYITGYFQGIVDFNPEIGAFNLTADSTDIFILKLDVLGNFVYAKSMGGNGEDIGCSIALDSDGNVYTTGSFQGTSDFDPGAGIFNMTVSPDVSGVYGNVDIFISKLNNLGNFVWAKSMGGDYYDYGYSIALDASSNVYTTGGFSTPSIDFDPGVGTFYLTSNGSYDIFISKLDSSGNFIWAKSIGGNGEDFGYSLKTDAYGNVYTVGDFTDTVDFDPGVGLYNLSNGGNRDFYILKLNSSGDFVFAIASGAFWYDECMSIILDDFGNIYYTGYFGMTFDFDPGTGTFNLTSAGGSDVFVCKLNQTTGLNENEFINTIKVFPNPSNGKVTITESDNSKLIEVFNLLGEKIYSTITNNNQTTTEIDLTNVPKGIYFVKVDNGKQVHIEKIVLN